MEKYGKKSYMRGGIVAALLAAVLSAFLLCLPQAANAKAETGTANVLLPRDGSVTYFYFAYPTAVYGDGNGFTVADGDKAYTFEKTDKQAPTCTDVAPRATALYPYGGGLLALSGGTLYEGTQALPIENNDGFADLTVRGDLVYAARENDILVLRKTDTGWTADTWYTHTKPLQKIAAAENGVYFTVANIYNPYQSDILFAQASARTPEEQEDTLPAAPEYARCVYAAADEILSLYARADGAVTLERYGVTAYALTGTKQDDTLLTVQHTWRTNDTVALSANGDDVYGISQSKSVFRLDGFSARTELLASAYGDVGFYRQNGGIASRKQTVAVADERNDRIQLLRENATDIISVSAPKDVAIDNAGNIFAVHGSTLSVFDANGKPLRSLPDLSGVLTVAVALDTRNNAYVLGSNGQVYRIAADAAVFSPDGMPSGIVAIGVSDEDGLLAARADNAVLCVKNGQTGTLFTAAAKIADVCTDAVGDIYVLTADGNIEKHVKKNGYALSLSHGFSFVHATSLAVNTAQFPQSARLPISYGDLLVSDTGAHAVSAVPRALLDVNAGIDVDKPADSVEDIEWDATKPHAGILYRVHACELYAQTAEIGYIAALPEGTTVIIPKYDPAALYQRIVTDDTRTDGKKPLVGYVAQSFIDRQIPYGDAPAVKCYQNGANVKIYTLPTRYAPTLPYTFTDKTAFTLCSFAYTNDKVYGYTDNYAGADAWLWCRIRCTVGEKTYEGYIPGYAVSLFGEHPDDRYVMPRINAHVVAHEAVLYEKIDGKMTEVTDPSFAPLKKGTGVEVVGTFDSSEKYTLIKYYHSDAVGTMTFYVRTSTLKHSGINRVAVVAIVIVAVTVLLGIALTARFLYVKRTKRNG